MSVRVLVDSDAKITSPTFTDADEVATDCDSTPTVAVVSRVTGSTLSAPTAVDAGDGVYTTTLTAAAHTGDLDVLDVTWTGAVGGAARVLRSTVEVVGGFYETIPGLREITTLSNASTRPTAQLRKFRAEIENIIEEARGTAYVERVAVEDHYLTSSTDAIRLRHRHPRTIRAVRIDGVAQTVGDYKIDEASRLIIADTAGWFTYDTTVTVAYTHGHLSPPVDLVEACREYVRAKCHTDSSNQQRNVSSVSSLATGETYRFLTADPKYGRWTGIEEVDARINMVADERVLVA